MRGCGTGPCARRLCGVTEAINGELRASEAIDVHSHYVPKGWPDLGPGAPSLRLESEREAVIMLRGQEFRRITASSWDASIRLADMAADGIGIQVVSPTPVFFSYTADVAQAVRIARIMNDLALEICSPAQGACCRCARFRSRIRTPPARNLIAA